ncbi:MAG TPA: AAA family ATPase, partial [Chlamydiales bacterium]|nr:AAA family ATPase [Chlamydiales bacterium]
MAELDELTAELLSEKPLILARYVVAAYLQGHSFVEIGNSLRPSLREIFPDEEVKEENIYKEIEAQALFFHPYFVHEGQRIYLRRAQHCEKKIAEELLRLLKREAVSAFAFDREKLNAEQLQALEQASQHSIFCLLGGPGTGKTYTAGHFLQAFFTAFQGPLPQVALVGPTGKAAANLEKSIFKAMGNDKERLASYCHTKTLHALLQKGRSVSKQSFFNYQLIIVDEASMIDAATMAEFLSRVGPDTRLLFLGDPYQLPSVEAGEVLHECMHHIPHATLIECQRTDLKEILHLASLVKEGKAEEALHFIKSNNNAVSFHPASEENFQVSLDTAFRII